MKTANEIAEANIQAELNITMQKKAKRRARIQAILMALFLLVTLLSWMYGVVQKAEATRMQQLAIQNQEIAIQIEKKLTAELAEALEALRLCQNKN